MCRLEACTTIAQSLLRAHLEPGRTDQKSLARPHVFSDGGWVVRTRQAAADRPMRRVWWQFRLRTLLVLTPVLAILLAVALQSDPYRWKARYHDVAVLMYTKNAQSNVEFAVARPDEAAIYLGFARQNEARMAYHQAMSRKYWSLAGRPWAWVSVPPDPSPPP
jgi:hypothetical protein